MIEYTVKVYDSGTKFWHLDGKLHRTDGPAIEWSDGAKSWWLDGKLHRTDGPAVVRNSGAEYWYLNGKLHRTDGPAIEDSGGTKYWYLDGKELTEEEHRKVTSKPSCDGKVVTVDGVEYTLKEV